MRPPRAAARAAAPAISAAGFGLLEHNDILHPAPGQIVAGAGGGGAFGSSFPVVAGIINISSSGGGGGYQEINGAAAEMRFRRENGDAAEEGAVVGGGSGEDVGGVGLENLAGGERRTEFLDFAVKMNHSDQVQSSTRQNAPQTMP